MGKQNLSNKNLIMSRNPQISLVLVTYRPGGMDLLAESLQQQPAHLYELIIVDDYLGRWSRPQVRKYMEDRGIPLTYHGPSKPRTNPYSQWSFANSINTGVLRSTTDYIILLNDFLYLPPGFIKQWLYVKDTYQKDMLLSAIMSVRETTPPELDSDISIWKDCGGTKHIGRETELWTPLEFETCCSGFPLDFFIKTNGVNETADDYSISWVYLTIVSQAKQLGYKLAADKRLYVIMANHRTWPESTKRKWNTCGLSKKYQHKAPDNWPAVSPHPYNLADLRKMYLEINESIMV